MFWPNLALSHQVFFLIIINYSEKQVFDVAELVFRQNNMKIKLIKIMSHKKLASKIEYFGDI